MEKQKIQPRVSFFKNSPCKDCINRIVTKKEGKICEKNCKLYQEFRSEVEKFKQKEKFRKEVNSMFFERFKK